MFYLDAFRNRLSEERARPDRSARRRSRAERARGQCRPAQRDAVLARDRAVDTAAGSGCYGAGRRASHRQLAS